MWLDHLAILDTDCNSHFAPSRHSVVGGGVVSRSPQGCKSRMSRQYLGLNDDEAFVTTKLQDVSFDGVTDRRLATRATGDDREEEPSPNPLCCGSLFTLSLATIPYIHLTTPYLPSRSKSKQ